MRKTALEPWIHKKIEEETGESHRFTLTLRRPLIEEYQLKKLRETLSFVSTQSPFYRERFAGLDVQAIHSLQDLTKIPFTTASDIKDNPQRFVCCSQDEISRIVTLESSGTTGPPKRVFFSATDQELTKDFFHHALSVVAKPGDKVLVMLPGERPGSVGDLFADAARRMDVVPVPYGFVRDPKDALEVIVRENINTLLGTPIHVLALATYEPPGESWFHTHIKNVIVNTDHLPQAVVYRIEQKWQCRVFNHYAMTEMGLGGGLECDVRHGYHMREADLLFEIVHPASGEPLADGEEGEVVFTTLTRQAMPLVRYRTGDFARFLPEPCPCGTVLKRMSPVKERVNSRVWLTGGGHLSISALDEAVFAIPRVLNFQVEVSSLPMGDRLTVLVQVAPWSESKVADRVHDAVGSIPAVARSVAKGYLTLESPTLTRSVEVWSPRKRMIKDSRSKERR